jgi:hypothetical protein
MFKVTIGMSVTQEGSMLYMTWFKKELLTKTWKNNSYDHSELMMILY